MFAAERSYHGLSAAGFHRIVYDVWGEEHAHHRTVICVHGLTRNAHDFDKLAAALSQKAQVVCVDIVGRGRSDWLRDPAFYNHAQYSADMAALLARLNVNAVDWIGTSMGGLIGMVLAAQANTPIQRLVLNDVGPFIPAAAMQRIATYVGLDPQFSGMEALLAFLRKQYQYSGPMTETDFQHMAQHGFRRLPNGKLGLAFDPAISKNFHAGGDVNLWPYYTAITCPTLVIHGAVSDVLTTETADAMTQSGPRAQLLRIPAIGHIPALQDAVQINAIKEFLNL